ncbi:MAG: FAD-binding protein [Clostridiales Family XIII bacterium]|jgi:succinate dehydrogenase/fumarate reductase flavoprotein subunit|nr:FAD-binding protein [Clostridiales Family XIII bacterium]
MEKFNCDVLIIGGSTAGLFAAVSAKNEGLDVLVADKAGAGYSGASIMASGFWSVFNEDWGMEYDSSLAFINKNSSYINNRDWSAIFLKESWQTYLDMKAWGVPFPVPEEEMQAYHTKIYDSNAGHDEVDPHSVYGMIPLSHRKVTPFLRKYAQRIGVRFMDRVMVTDLLEKDGQIFGAVGFPMDGDDRYVIRAKATVLSAGRNYFKPPGMNVSGQTGDADAMAYRAGAVISGKEFPDMHMNIAKDPMWKGTGEIYPAYFEFDDGYGRRLPNRGFDLSLASTIHAGYGPIVWDFGKATERDLKTINEYLIKRGNPKEIERVGLDPAAGGKFPMIGGAAAGGCQESSAGLWPVDLDGASNLKGLYAAGDCLATWMWGAHMQGPPPGLAPAAVTGKRAGNAAAAFVKSADALLFTEPDIGAALAHAFRARERDTGFDPHFVFQLLQNYMMPWYVLHIKHADRMKPTLELLSFLRTHTIPKMRAENTHELRICHETENMALNAEMILRSSLMREESRGWHFREDFPVENDDWQAWVLMQQDENGQMVMHKKAVPEAWRKPPTETYAQRWLAWEHPFDV